MERIAIVGLGYVGLPLAVEFARKYQVVGFDINPLRVANLLRGSDDTFEVNSEQLVSVLNPRFLDGSEKGLDITFSLEAIANCTIFIITVPTPTDIHNRPDLTPLRRASESVGMVLKKGDTVIYESTVYPGVTEDECVPILERFSKLKFNTDFVVGYSPERINPGDKEHTVTKIRKVTSGSTPEAAEKVDQLYKSVISAGTFKASSIKVAEAAKVIENTQRDINIAFVNELAKIFNRLGIDTKEVLEAAGTKWNFLKFQPGLVGGHCIGVDPYYLAQKAQEVGYHPEIILAGRRMNDSMGGYVAKEVIKLMIKRDMPVKGASILILGFTFKENCPDVRNTRVIDIYKELIDYQAVVDVYDPWASKPEVKNVYGIDVSGKEEELSTYDAIILAVAHEQFLQTNLAACSKKNTIIYDVKGFFDKTLVTGRL